MFLVSLMAPPATWLPLEVRKISNRVLPAQKAWKWFIYTPVLSMSDFSPRITKTEFFPMKKQTKGTKTKQKQAWNFLLTAFVFSGYLSDNICFLLLFLMGTQNFFFVPRSWQDEKTSFLISTLLSRLCKPKIFTKLLMISVFILAYLLTN